MNANPSNYPGMAICSGAVALDQCTVDQAYQKWKKFYQREYNSLGDEAWQAFRMAVSRRVGRGIAVYYESSGRLRRHRANG